MDVRSYYDIAKSDFEFLKFYYSHIDGSPSYNPLCVQEQQIVEKLLKHVIDKYIDSNESIDYLHSHKLVNILRFIRQYFDCNISEDDMRFLTDFYFDCRYPSRDYIITSKDDVIRGYRITEEVFSWVTDFINNKDCNTDLPSLDLFE